MPSSSPQSPESPESSASPQPRQTRRSPRPAHHDDASGPLLAWCVGHRCAALRRLSRHGETTDRIKSTIAGTAGAVMVSSTCLGRCELASVAAVGRRDGSSGQAGPLVWFTGTEQGTRFEALESWISTGGPRNLVRPDAAMPAALSEATCGISGPPTLHRR
ncbi:hypothetical protein [Citricoccus sp. GCM10030269]|uniref:hypothetical protein n=1 Tax=Citricoccus sp. GCM10030269 TaxID=3273388 RepID=UPI0036069AD6